MTQTSVEDATRGNARKVLLISHVAPPQPNAGAARLAAFVRYLPENGWQPIVVTSRFAGDGGVGGAATIRRSEPLVWFQRAQVAPPAEQNWQPTDGLSRTKRLVLERLAVPDIHAGWVPLAWTSSIRAGLNAHALVSTSPAASAHLVGLGVSTTLGIPWVAEFRDGWMVDGLRDLSQQPIRSYVERAQERCVGAHATALVGVTRPIARDLKHRFGSGLWIPNGFDDELITVDDERRAARLIDPEAFNLVYTGRFSFSRSTRSPSVLVEALRRLSLRTDQRKLRLVVAGPLTPGERVLLKAVPSACLAGEVPRGVALALQRLADANLLVTTPGEPTVATGKLFEYIGAGKPILALAADNEAAVLMEELGAGILSSPTNPEVVQDALARLLDGGTPFASLDDPRVKGFHRRPLTRRLAALLDSVQPGPIAV